MITALVFLATFLVLVVAHESGHFLAAKLTGVYAKEFAVGFGPKLLSVRGQETRYSIRLIPFGGYVRLAGEDRTETSSEIPSDRLLYNKPPLSRILISLAGPATNLFVTLLVTVLVLWSSGIPYQQVADVIPGRPASALLRPGDRVISIDGRAVYDSETLSRLIQGSGGEPLELLVNRDEELIAVPITPLFEPVEGRYLIGAYFLTITYTNEITMLDPASPLFLAGLQVGDRIVAVNGEEVTTAIGIVVRLEELLPTDSIALRALRGGEEREIQLSPARLTLDQILTGIMFSDLGIENQRPGFVAGLILGAAQFSDDFRMMVDVIHGILTGRIAAREAIAGPIGIARLLGESLQRGPSMFLRIFAFFSMSLGLFNLIPFPALDGSRAAFALYELVCGKPIPARREGMIHAIGFLVLIAVMILVTYQDILKLFQ